MVLTMRGRAAEHPYSRSSSLALIPFCFHISFRFEHTSVRAHEAAQIQQMKDLAFLFPLRTVC